MAVFVHECSNYYNIHVLDYYIHVCPFIPSWSRGRVLLPKYLLSASRGLWRERTAGSSTTLPAPATKTQLGTPVSLQSG